MNNSNNPREIDLRRAHLMFLIINTVFSVLLIIRVLRSPGWELWVIPIIAVLGTVIWIVYFKNIFSLRARSIIIAGTSLLFLYYFGCHYEVFLLEFPLCLGLFSIACESLDEHIVTCLGIVGYYLVLLYHVFVMRDPSIISANYLPIVVMLTILFFSRYLIGKHSREVEYFDESIARMDEERKSREFFLANVSHELRTPVNAISGMTEILLKRELDDDIREEVLSIEKAGKKLSNQIDDIMDFSEIISESLVDESETYFFNDLLNELKDAEAEIATRNNVVFWDVDSEIPSALFGDKKKIRRIFNNVFRNAYEIKGGGNVHIRVHARKEEYGINLAVAVRDEGPGISQEDIDRAYYGARLTTNINNRQEGLKIGLVIANGLTRFMNGFMLFDVEPGVGTTVTFTIPQKVINEDYWKEESIEVKEEEDIPDLRNAKILIVDDDHMNLNVAKKMFSVYGGDVKQADSGMSALELCKDEEFDLIFMDHMMPGMDGIETYRAIKTHPSSKNKSTAVIALTANAVSGAKEMFLTEGFIDFVSKPIDRKALERAIFGAYKNKGRIEEENHMEIMETTGVQEAGNAQEIPAALEKDKMNLLSEYGVNTGDALNYCAGSEEFYFMMLTDFASQIEDKISELTGYMDSGDEDNYRIKIHALKSNTKTLGFDEISEMARLSEMACKEGKFFEAQSAHAGIMDKLREIGSLLNGLQ